MKGINPKILFGGLILFAIGYCFTKLPFTSFLFLVGVAIVLYGFTKSLLVVLVTFLIPILLQIFNSSMGVKSSKPVVATASLSVPDRLKNIKVEVKELSGAGDSVLAVLSYCFSEGYSFASSVDYANKLAAKFVSSGIQYRAKKEDLFGR